MMQQQIDQAVSILVRGGVVAYPTDTVYGLGADAFNEQAVERIYCIKQRPADRPLSVLIGEKAQVLPITRDLPSVAGRLMDQFWPGGVTLVLPKVPSVPEWITAGRDTLAVRMPDHPVTLELIRRLGKPLIGTSANLSGLPSSTTAAGVRAQLKDAVDFTLDGGICPGGMESTVVDVSGETVFILREGPVSRDVLAAVCENVHIKSAGLG